MSGEGMIAAARDVLRASEERGAACCATASLHEREDVLAYLARRRVNCELVAGRCPEFAEDAKVQVRQLGVLIDEISGGLHEGEHAHGVTRAKPASGPYPFRDHRTLAEVLPASSSEAVGQNSVEA